MILWYHVTRFACFQVCHAFKISCKVFFMICFAPLRSRSDQWAVWCMYSGLQGIKAWFYELNVKRH